MKRCRWATKHPSTTLTTAATLTSKTIVHWSSISSTLTLVTQISIASFNSADLVSVFSFGQYEDAMAGNSTWLTGDWNADGEFNSGDFVAAFEQGGYELGPKPLGVAVPETVLFACCRNRLRTSVSVATQIDRVRPRGTRISEVLSFQLIPSLTLTS